MLVAEQEQCISIEQPADKPVLKASEAGQLLAVGHNKLAQLLKTWKQTHNEGLAFQRSALDHRGLLIKRSDVLALLEQSQGVTVEEARRQLRVSHAKMKELIDTGELPVRNDSLYRRKRFVDKEKFDALLAERNINSSLRREVKEGSS